MIKVCQYRCFESDRRLSMDIYADQLQAAFFTNKKFKIEQYQPTSKLERYSSNKYLMRYLRYSQYPRGLNKQKADIHHVIDHGYAHLLPKLSAGKKCISVHDLIPLLKWKGLILGDNNNSHVMNNTSKPYLNLFSLSFLKKYDKIITVSNSTANDLIRHLLIQPDDITVIPPIINSNFKLYEPKQVAKFSRKFNFDNNCKWVMISGQQFYKNLGTSLKVLKELNLHSDTPIKLVKTGFPSDNFDKLIATMGLENLVKCIFVESIDELPLLYNFVDCFLFPSLYEGFGMPVAEALACGTPVVASNRGSLIEVGGKLATYFEPGDIKGLSGAVNEAIFNSKTRQERCVNGAKWVKQFRSVAVSNKLDKVYQELSHCKKSVN